LPTGFVPASPAFRSQRTNRNRRNHAKQPLTIRLHANERTIATERSITSCRLMSIAATPAAPTTCLCASADADRTKTLLRSRRTSRETSTHPGRVSLASSCNEDARTGLCEASRRLGLETRVPHRYRSHGLFCIRLHFVRKERIGVEKISAKRFLTISEVGRSCP
jgi:hypothetical protein